MHLRVKFYPIFPFENSYPHLGHIINSKFDDSDDVKQRRCHFIGQANNVLCYFNKLDLHVKIKLFKSYCSSIYGGELWSLESDFIQDFCCAWRSALRRLLKLPYKSHCFLLHVLTDTLPVFDEICKRSARFIFTCLNSRYQLVRNVTYHALVYGRYRSVLGRNLRFCCQRFDWKIDDFMLGLVSLDNHNFLNFCIDKIEPEQLQTAQLLLELICLREGYDIFDCGHFLSRSEIDSLITFVASG